MTVGALSVAPFRFRPASFLCLLAAALLLGFVSGLPWGLGVAVAAVAVGAAAAVRAHRSPGVAMYAPAPALLGIAFVACIAPVGLGTELIAGVVGLGRSQ